MPSCQLEVNLSGEALDTLGMPTSLKVWGRVLTGACQRVEFTVRAGQGGIVLTSGQANTDSNGTWSAVFAMPLVTWPCGSHLWVEARCVEAGDCSTARLAEVKCKLPGTPGGGGGGNGGGGEPGGGGGSGGNGSDGGASGWPWDWPPHIWCPMVGRTFITALVTALGVILLGSALGNLVMVTGGVALVGAAFATLAFWRLWCAPNWCYVLGSLFWVFGRATIGGIAVTLAALSAWAGVWTLAFGACAAAFYIALLQRRCAVPSLATPLAQLPLW